MKAGQPQPSLGPSKPNPRCVSYSTPVLKCQAPSRYPSEGGDEAALAPSGVTVGESSSVPSGGYPPTGVDSPSQPEPLGGVRGDCGGAGGGAPAGSYKDTVANVFLGSTYEEADDLALGEANKKRDPFYLEKLQPPCPTYALIGQCDDCGTKFAKTLYCGREWCGVCKEPTENRRLARWLPKAQQMAFMGYFVLEWPMSSRHKLRTEWALAEAGKIVKAVLSGDFEVEMWRASGEILTEEKMALTRAQWFRRGLRRWHYFGEPTDEMRYNPHLNVLLDAGYLSKRRLERIKAFLRIALGEPKLIVHYHYTAKPSNMVHHLRYVVRNTFLDVNWDVDLAYELRGFRNALFWGTWDDEPVWTSRGEGAVARLESGTCPDCGGDITWDRIVEIAVLNRAIAEGRACSVEPNGVRGSPSSPSGYYRLAPDFGEPRPITKETDPNLWRLLHGDEQTLEELLDF
jgi:hypothetical protein